MKFNLSKFLKHEHHQDTHKIETVNQIPGQVTYVGTKTDIPLSLEVFNFNKKGQERLKSDKIESAFNLDHPEEVSWVNISGLHETKKIEQLGKHYKLHPLIIEDIVDTEQRPKIDEYENYFFIVLKMLYFKNGELSFEHVSLILGENYVLSFQEAEGDVFDPLRKRIINAKGRVRSLGADYLMYAIIDAIIDHYFLVIERIGDAAEAMEDQLFLDKGQDDITQKIQVMKREILKVRRSIYPLREVVNRLEKNEHPLIQVKTHNYLRDLYDHIIQVSENIEIYREMIWGLMDMYMTTISNKMNEVMKVLTIMASIFIPLTFMAGIYGMNFEHMPELKWEYSYYCFWGVIIVVFLLMLWYFKRKRWL
jgi:magnesium transporter